MSTERGDSTIIRKTVIERGYRTVDSSGGRAGLEAARNLALQHEDEKREMQELNSKFGSYLERVKFLETQNRKLQAQLDDLKQKWGFDSGKVKDQYDQSLIALRKQIDDVTRDKALAELRAKRAEYDASLIKHQTDFAHELVNLDRTRFTMLKQQLEGSGSELEVLRNRFEDKKQDIDRNKGEVRRLLDQLENLKNEFDQESMARVMIQNELQTLEEQLAFMRAVHEEERNELASLGTLPIDVSQFYRTELTRAIADIKSDFEALSQAQRRELEEYYRIKTEEIRQQANEQKRKIEEARNAGVVDAMDLTSLKSLLTENRENYNTLQKDHTTLANQLRQLEEDFERISFEHSRGQSERERELAELRAQAERRQSEIDCILENNVSLRFEINTYRRLLEVEEGRIQIKPTAPEVSTKKMTVQKSARGAITIDQVDPQGNFIVIENAGSTGKDQDLNGWTLRRRVDNNNETVYKFPDHFVLKSRSRVRILSRTASKSSTNEREVLVADGIQNWGTGTNMVTRLVDNNGEEKALFNQRFQ
ncbi:unnamed protein product [Rotaria sordida]|uniref:Intermediate filament protein n=1 Tax=Rotaria sordida TaxID=392033 RepID=A0A814QWN8_9BILA|nr:unnamed protein product [Rotaria sordida]CAF1041584.1 unnamed protein product [Rotaria sordida]CAF1125244.1 unnamed protein product [Rotaria sordida]CAF1185136.1 unnamed protein product [Rotaria sordida]CAF1187249.1 unnamed protein product [Rotaria sordida]